MISPLVRIRLKKHRWLGYNLHHALDADKNPCDPRSTAAREFTLKGALQNCHSDEELEIIYPVMLQKIKKIIRYCYSVDLFNEMATHRQLMTLITEMENEDFD